jgi:hypothetical protein
VLALLAGGLLLMGVLPRAEAEGPDRPAKKPFKRLSNATEEDLRKQLSEMTEIGLGRRGSKVAQTYASNVKRNAVTLNPPTLPDATALLNVCPDLRTLPIRTGPDCQLSPAAAGTLEVLARKLRLHLTVTAPPAADGSRPGMTVLQKNLRLEKRGQRPEWLRAEAIPTLTQLLMAEDSNARRMLVDMLAEIADPRATKVLAQRAVFDLDPAVREAAVAALKGRPVEDYQPFLLKTLRYPWAPPAQHAAEALAALETRDAVATLVTLLKLPDPGGPQVIDKSRATMPEVVRANHLQNCLMCHAPAWTMNDPVLALDPWATRIDRQLLEQIVGPKTAQRLLCTPGGYDNPSTPGRVPVVIRADITFLRQDFSVKLPVVKPPNPLVPEQRFDFMVRNRPLSTPEKGLLKTWAEDHPDYPQRDAVLFALCELTGKDPGRTTEAWQKLFPRAETEALAGRLCRQLRTLDPLRREALLHQMREGKEPANTLAIAWAIPNLPEGSKEQARTALTERLMRLPSESLREQLGEKDPEIRQAAVRACTRKEDKAFVPDLIAMLDDGESRVAKTAEGGLQSLTGQRFSQAAAWKEWWKSQDPKAEGKRVMHPIRDRQEADRKPRP